MITYTLKFKYFNGIYYSNIQLPKIQANWGPSWVQFSLRVCLVEWILGRMEKNEVFGWKEERKKMWWDWGVLSPSSPKCFLPEMGRKLRERVWFFRWTKMPLVAFLGNIGNFSFLGKRWVFFFFFFGDTFPLPFFSFDFLGWVMLALFSFSFFG